MRRRTQVTYGRQTRTTASTPWLSDDSTKGVFSNSSQNESTSDTSHQNIKENQASDHAVKARMRPRRKKNATYIDSSTEDIEFTSTSRRRPTALKDKKNIPLPWERDSKKPTRKRDAVPRKEKDRSDKPKKSQKETVVSQKLPEVNFSEFDEYSLMVVDSLEYNNSRESKLKKELSWMKDHDESKNALECSAKSNHATVDISLVKDISLPVVKNLQKGLFGTSTPDMHRQSRHRNPCSSPNMSVISLAEISVPENGEDRADLETSDCVAKLNRLGLESSPELASPVIASPALASPVFITSKQKKFGDKLRKSSVLCQSTLNSIAESDPSRSLFSETSQASINVCENCKERIIEGKEEHCQMCKNLKDSEQVASASPCVKNDSFKSANSFVTDAGHEKIESLVDQSNDEDEYHSCKSASSEINLKSQSVCSSGEISSSQSKTTPDKKQLEEIVIIEEISALVTEDETESESDDDEVDELSDIHEENEEEIDDVKNDSEVANDDDENSDCYLYSLNPDYNSTNEVVSNESTISDSCVTPKNMTHDEEDLPKRLKISPLEDLPESPLDVSLDVEHVLDETNLRKSTRKAVGRLSISVCSANLSYGIGLSPAKPELLLPPKDKVLQLCNQKDFISFKEFIPPKKMKQCKKIGEGVYGEVFRTKSLDSDGHNVALKIIPIEGELIVNDEKQKIFSEMLPEILITRELDDLRNMIDNQTDGFAHVDSVACIKGNYPAELLKQWDTYHEEKESENDRPDKFTDDQLFIGFEFRDAGTDLASFKFANIREGKSVLQQVVVALAVAELQLQFEHRDLHWGNILVQRTENRVNTYSLGGHKFEFDNQGIHVTIIDFTLSRLLKDGDTIFCDLSTDETLFTGEGDYQFEIYRLMKIHNNNSWESYNPYTNVLWIHYVLDKLIKEVKYKTKNTKVHQKVMRTFRGLHKNLLEFESAADILLQAELFD